MPFLKIAIVGSGEEEQEIKSLSTSLCLDNNIDFLGFKSNPLKLLHDAKVMVMSSRWEGTPMIALEAIALGTPIISTPTDGMNDLIENGVNGFLINDDCEYAKTLIKIIMEEDLHQELVKNQLTKSKVVNDIDNYKSVLLGLYLNVVKSNE